MLTLIKFPFIWLVALYGFHKKWDFHILIHRCNFYNSGLKNNKARYAAGAVMKKANLSIWAGAVMQKLPINAKKANGHWPTNQQT